VNSLRANGTRQPKDYNQGIVLNLRNRYSLLRNKVRPSRTASQREGTLIEAGSPEQERADLPLDGRPSNPWATARAGESFSQSSLNHRMSFDPASGVMMLPEDDDWLIDDVSSDEDYGNSTPEQMQGGNSNASHEDLSASITESISTPLASPGKRRYGTYYHHPERRRQTIPGAFPPSSSS